MMKKNELLETLAQGGYIHLDDIYRSASVYDAAGDRLDSCRYDTSEKLAALDEYQAESLGAWSYSRRITQPEARAAALEAAAEDLEEITTPGTIELRAKADCYIGKTIKKGAHFLVTVYGDGSHDVPGNGYGKLYDFRGDLHAVHFEIISRPEAAQAEELTDDDQSARRDYLVTFHDAASGEERTERINALNEEHARRIAWGRCDDLERIEAVTAAPKQYAKADGSEATRSASEALAWHRAGYDIIVAQTGRAAVYVHGAPQKPARSAADENREYCRRVALEVEAYANDEMKRCPECGEIHRRDWGEVGEVFRCPSCGEVSSVDDWEWLGLYAYIDDALDLEFTVSRNREYISGRIMVAFGGPTVYVDTGSGRVELYWWNERADYLLDSDARDALDECLAELWEM